MDIKEQIFRKISPHLTNNTEVMFFFPSNRVNILIENEPISSPEKIQLKQLIQNAVEMAEESFNISVITIKSPLVIHYSEKAYEFIMIRSLRVENSDMMDEDFVMAEMLAQSYNTCACCSDPIAIEWNEIYCDDDSAICGLDLKMNGVRIIDDSLSKYLVRVSKDDIVQYLGKLLEKYATNLI